MVMGVFGVFDQTELLAEFGDDESADEYRREVLEIPSSLYDDLLIAEVPEDYDLWIRLLRGLKKSRAQDRAIETALRWLRLAQWERRLVRDSA